MDISCLANRWTVVCLNPISQVYGHWLPRIKVDILFWWKIQKYWHTLFILIFLYSLVAMQFTSLFRNQWPWLDCRNKKFWGITWGWRVLRSSLTSSTISRYYVLRLTLSKILDYYIGIQYQFTNLFADSIIFLIRSRQVLLRWLYNSFLWIIQYQFWEWFIKWINVWCNSTRNSKRIEDWGRRGGKDKLWKGFGKSYCDVLSKVLLWTARPIFKNAWMIKVIPVENWIYANEFIYAKLSNHCQYHVCSNLNALIPCHIIWRF